MISPRSVLALSVLLIVAPTAFSADPPRTGPETEKRFPPLKLPPGFKATLFACDPFIEYPSAIAAGPTPGSLFVAIDYMTGLGEEIIRRDEVRLIEDTDGDGYADRSTVFASGFNSIMGLAYHDGTLFVMHAPFLTSLRNENGVGKDRRDLLKGLGLTPEENSVRLHCANGVSVGHDGWLYLALGDHGCDVPRPEGDRLVLNGGGLLRCRPDGKGLHVFAKGTRNVYGVALDAALNVFFRDNENDGGTFMIRVCLSFFGADHGYPYLYTDRPNEALQPLADLGRGSSAGNLVYRETLFPPEYRGNLFCCEWGRSVVRYKLQPAGSGFGPVQEIEFAAAAENDPYGFKPTDLAVQRDGALMIADWADGQRPKRGRGRIYRVVPAEPSPAIPKKPDDISALDSESYYERLDAQLSQEKKGTDGLKPLRRAIEESRVGSNGRAHAVWMIARTEGSKATAELLSAARTDPDSGVRAQAIRAVTDLAEPGNTELAEKLTVIGETGDAFVRREVIVALGRLRWSGLPAWLAKVVKTPDAAESHAAMQALRTCGNWNDVVRLLDLPGKYPMQSIAMRAVAEEYEPVVVDGLISRLKQEELASRRQQFADVLTRVHRKPGPWEYWGYRPLPRPANTVDWERTTTIAEALDRVLADPDRSVRLAILKRMQREKVPIRAESLTSWLREEHGAEVVAAILESMREIPPASAREPLRRLVQDQAHSEPNRVRALSQLTAALPASDAGLLLEIARSLDDGPVLAEVLRQVGKHPSDGAAALLVRHVGSYEAVVRAAAIEALAELKSPEAAKPTLTRLGDREAIVRRAAAAAAGRLKLRDASESLLKLTRDADAGVRSASLTSLSALGDARAVPFALAALDDRHTQLAALECLGSLGGPAHLGPVRDLARQSPPSDVLTAIVRILAAWAKLPSVPDVKRRELDQAVAEIQGESGSLLRWRTKGPVREQEAAAIAERSSDAPLQDWETIIVDAGDSRIRVGSARSTPAPDAVWFAASEVFVPDTAAVEFSVSSPGAIEVWLNGKSIHARPQSPDGRARSARINAQLVKGTNRILVRVGRRGNDVEFTLSFRRSSSTAALEKLMQAALTRSGDVEKGRALFLNAEKSLCMKCHHVGEQGERIGPDLTGIGARFGRVYLIESILEPGRTVVQGFSTLRVETADGRVLTGVKAAETDTVLTLVDNQAKKFELKKSDIVDQKPASGSAMPDGLEKRITEQEFIDLVAFLVSLKERGPSP